MPLEDSLDVLESRVRDSAQALENLLWATVEAQPRQGAGHALVDYYETAATDAADHARQALVYVRQMRRAPHTRRGVATAAKYLRLCTEHIGELTNCMLSGISSLQSVSALEQLAGERKGVWASWVHGVKDAIAKCQAETGACATALPNCWHGLLGQILPAISAPRANAGRLEAVVKDAGAKLSNETETKIPAGRCSDERRTEQYPQ